MREEKGKNAMPGKEKHGRKEGTKEAIERGGEKGKEQGCGENNGVIEKFRKLQWQRWMQGFGLIAREWKMEQSWK